MSMPNMPSTTKSVRFGGKKQVNFGIESDVFEALCLARVRRGKRNSEIINDALRKELKQELSILSTDGS